MYKCSACGETFESQIELREHEKDCQQQADGATAGPKK
jgi:DNA-directed RNA polymerase subunit RPC12/RpoP